MRHSSNSKYAHLLGLRCLLQLRDYFDVEIGEATACFLIPAGGTGMRKNRLQNGPKVFHHAPLSPAVIKVSLFI